MATIDQLQVEITAITKDFNSAIKGVKSDLDSLGGHTQKASAQMGAGFEKIGAIATKTLAVGVVGAIAAIAAAVPSAVRRIDTLNNSARTFENMGFKTDIAGKAMDRLESSIMGLPTPLDSAVRGMTGLAATYGDIDRGQKVFTSLNNAILGFGGSAAEVDNAIQQLSQLPMDGPLDAQTWNSLRNSGLTPVLVAMSKEFGMSVGEMRNAFGDGTLTVEDFTNKLIEMNEKGGGGLKSLEQIARDSTKGIGTGFANMQTAIARGVAGIIAAIGSENIANAITNIGKAFESVLKSIAGVVNFVAANSAIFAPIAAGIAGMVTAITAWYIATKLMTVAQTALSIALTANPIGIIIVAVAALVAALIYLWTTSEGFRNFFIGMWNSIVAAVQPAVTIFTTYLLPILKEVWAFVASQFKQAWDNLTKAFNEVKNALMPLIERCEFLMPILKAIGIAVAVSVIAPLALMVAAIVAVISIIAAVVSVIANFIGWLARLYAKLVEVASLVIGTVVNSFRNAWSIISSVWGNAVGFFGGVVNGIAGAIGRVYGIFSSVFHGAWNIVTSIFGRLASWFGSIDLSGSGRAIINSFIGGIRSMIGAVKNAVSSVVQSVRDFFPFSPAKEGPLSGKGYTSHSGKALMQDFGKGMTAGAKGLDRTISRAILPATDVLSGLSANLPTSSQLNGRLSMGTSPRLRELNGKQTPVNVQLDGDTLLSFVIDGVNGQTFMTNRSTLIV